MSFIKEFKEFALKGNVVDMAVGIIIGAAFGKLINSIVADLIMPPLGLVVGGMDFSDLSLTLKNETGNNPAVTINYGEFITVALNFLIISFAIFLVVKGINALRRGKKLPAKSRQCPECLMEVPKAAKKCGHCTSEI